jgi:hypothetical protein
VIASARHVNIIIRKGKQKNSRVYRLNDPKDKLEKENQNVILYKEKKTIENREKNRKKKQNNSSWMCLFLSYPIFLIGNWPFFLSFPFCSSFSLLLRVAVCQLHSAPVVHVPLKNKTKKVPLIFFLFCFL